MARRPQAFATQVDFFRDTVCAKCGASLAPFSMMGQTEKCYCAGCRASLQGAERAELDAQDRRDEALRQALVSGLTGGSGGARRASWVCALV